MKEASETFVADNGTITKGERFPDGHSVVRRHDDKFTDVADEDVTTTIDGTSDTPVSAPSPSQAQADATADATADSKHAAK